MDPVPVEGSIIFEKGFYYKIHWVKLKVNISDPFADCCSHYPHTLGNFRQEWFQIFFPQYCNFDGLKCGEIFVSIGRGKWGNKDNCSTTYYRDLDGKVYQIVKMQLKKIPTFPEGYEESLVTEVEKHKDARRDCMINRIANKFQDATKEETK
jgi:hypothetical protein